MDLNYTVYNKSCQDMSDINSKTIDLIFTSPPYWDLKDYNNDWQIWYKQTYEAYLKDMKIVFNECARVVKDTGVFCININSRVVKWKYYPIHIDFYSILKDIWFNYYDNIIWHKASWIPSSAKKFSDRFEYIVIASKNKINFIVDNSSEYLNPELQNIKSRHIKKKAWSLLSKQPHPAYFPIQLAGKAIETFTREWDTILDPFLWIGSTLIASMNLKRSWIWFEINKEYIKTMQQSIEKDQVNHIFFTS